MDAATKVKTDDPGATVPLDWPAMRTDAPPLVRTIRGLLTLPAMFLLWFAPKRTGVFIAGAGWHAAIWASLIGIGIGLGLPACRLRFTWASAFAGPQYLDIYLDTPIPCFTLSELPRAPLASLLLGVHTETSNPWWYAAPWYTFLLILAAILVSLLALATMMMPFTAAGERLGLLFGRCLRLVLWSMTILIPIGAIVLFWPWISERVLLSLLSPEHPEAGREVLEMDHRTVIAVFVVFALWWLFVLWRSGLRYAGPADGPAWRPRTPRCAKCGYVIATLQVNANCPECNHPVADSVARLRRSTKFTHWRAFIASVRDAWPFGRQA